MTCPRCGSPLTDGGPGVLVCAPCDVAVSAATVAGALVTLTAVPMTPEEVEAWNADPSWTPRR